MIIREETCIIRRFDKNLLVIEPWGKNSLRVRDTQRYNFIDNPDLSALLPKSSKHLEEDRQNTSTWEENGSTFIKVYASK